MVTGFIGKSKLVKGPNIKKVHVGPDVWRKRSESAKQGSMLESTPLTKEHMFYNLMADLKDLDVLINKKDFTCQIGEWLVASLYDGERSTNGIQKDWDIKVGEKNVLLLV